MNSLKVVIIGESSSGKTTLLKSYLSDDSETSPTFSTDTKLISIQSRGRIIQPTVLDTSGQKEFKYVLPPLLLNAQVIVVVFDLSNCTTPSPDYLTLATKNFPGEMSSLLLINLI